MKAQRGGVKGRNILDIVVEVERWGLFKHMRGFDKAGVLFADFRADFPVIFSKLIFRVFL